MDTENVITCPYNSSHRIVRHRMPYHIIKCVKNYKGPPLDRCPFNAMHRVLPEKMKDHIKDCPNYHIVMREKYEREYANQLENSFAE